MMAALDHDRCTGCTACAAVCPSGCLSMAVDGEGFSYPQVDTARCTSCGACGAVCPALHPLSQSGPTPEAWAARALDEPLRQRSSSGGIFGLLAREVLSSGGAVFGAALTPDCKSVEHTAAESDADLAPLLGSKYLQSELGDTLLRVRAALEGGRRVLFTGTPCQIDGLKSFLQKPYEYLLCVEIICHGVPSPLLWRAYVAHREKKLGTRIQTAHFRHKRNGWRAFGLHLMGTNGKASYDTLHKDPFLRMFLRDHCLRPSCYGCPSKGLGRPADLTIGDFWGVEHMAPQMDDDRGTSLVLVHTPAGQAALDTIGPRTQLQQVDCAQALAGNPAMVRSATRPPQRETFFPDLRGLSFPALCRRYVPDTPRDRVRLLLEKTHLLPLARRMLGRGP